MKLEQIDGLRLHQEADGVLGVIEFKDLPFVPQRMYWIFDVPAESSRGSHAHKELRQCFFALRGRFTLTIRDGISSESLNIEVGDSVTYVGPGLWRELTNFSADAIACVIVDSDYKEEDYIHDWSEFKEWARIRNTP